MEQLIHFFSDNLTMVYLLTFAVFLGFEVIAKVPTVLHTPLMSGSNAISGVVLIGAILLIRQTSSDDILEIGLCMLGIFFGALNMVGGFTVTNRMLEMFKKKQ